MKNTTATPKRASAKCPVVPNQPMKQATDSARKPCEWTDTQEMVIDSISDLLVNGGPPEALEALVMAAIEVHARRLWTTLCSEGEELEQHVRKTHSQLQREWRFNLEAAGRANRRAPEADRQMPVDASGRIREVVRDRAVTGFKNFLAFATPEELRLLVEIWEIFESNSTGPMAPTNEVPLALSFSCAIDRASAYIRVPERLQKKVEIYLGALLAIEGKEI